MVEERNVKKVVAYREGKGKNQNKKLSAAQRKT